MGGVVSFIIEICFRFEIWFIQMNGIVQIMKQANACSFLATTQKRTKKGLRPMKSFLENYAPRQPQKNSSFQSSNSFCAQYPPCVLVFYDRFHMRGRCPFYFFIDNL